MDKKPIVRQGKRGDTLLLCGSGCGSLLAVVDKVVLPSSGYQFLPFLQAPTIALVEKKETMLFQDKRGVFRWGQKEAAQGRRYLRRKTRQLLKEEGKENSLNDPNPPLPRRLPDGEGENLNAFDLGALRILAAHDWTVGEFPVVFYPVNPLSYPTWRVACHRCGEITTIDTAEYQPPGQNPGGKSWLERLRAESSLRD